MADDNVPAFSEHPGHGDTKRTVESFSAESLSSKKSHPSEMPPSERHGQGLAGMLKYKGTPSD